VELNSGVGRRSRTYSTTGKKLTLFLEKVGLPLNNNTVGRALKKAILHRNYVHQVSTWRCAAKSKVKGTEIGFSRKRNCT